MQHLHHLRHHSLALMGTYPQHRLHLHQAAIQVLQVLQGGNTRPSVAGTGHLAVRMYSRSRSSLPTLQDTRPLAPAVLLHTSSSRGTLLVQHSPIRRPLQLGT
jgi:hypothetical protein